MARQEARVVTFTGELHLGLEDSIYPHLDEGVSNLVLDMSGVTRVSSSALGFFIKVKKMVERDRGDLVLVGVTGHLKRALEILGLDEYFRVFPSDEEAFEYFEHRGGGGATP
jgi:anti-anti-sigma factor